MVPLSVLLFGSQKKAHTLYNSLHHRQCCKTVVVLSHTSLPINWELIQKSTYFYIIFTFVKVANLSIDKISFCFTQRLEINQIAFTNLLCNPKVSKSKGQHTLDLKLNDIFSGMDTIMFLQLKCSCPSDVSVLNVYDGGVVKH